MNMIGRNSSLFKGEPVVSQPVRVENASADLLNFHRQHKERMARISTAAPLAKTALKSAEPRKIDPPAPEVSHQDPDVYRAAVQNAMDFIGPRPRDYIYVSSPHRPQPTLRQIMREVVERYGISEIDLLSQRRKKQLCTARHEFCWRAKSETSQSYPQIARFLGGRDHTTALSSARRYQWMIDTGKIVAPKTEGEGE